RVGADAVSRPVASPDGASVAGAWATTLTVWDVAQAKALWHKDFKKEEREVSIDGLAFSPDGKALAVGMGTDVAEVARLYDAGSGRELRRFPLARKERGDLRGMAFAPDGRWLATAYRGRSHLHVWDVRTGEVIRSIHWQFERKSRRSGPSP